MSSPIVSVELHLFVHPYKALHPCILIHSSPERH